MGSIDTTLIGEEDPEMERERPFLSDKQSRLFEYVFMHSTPRQSIYTCCQWSATISPPVKDGEHKGRRDRWLAHIIYKHLDLKT